MLETTTKDGLVELLPNAGLGFTTADGKTGFFQRRGCGKTIEWWSSRFGL